jgi:hypothetical protein
MKALEGEVTAVYKEKVQPLLAKAKVIEIMQLANQLEEFQAELKNC